MAVDWAFPAVGFISLEPSPFWLPVLLLSLQYGTVAGLLAAAVATAAYVFNGFADQAIDENYFAYLLRIWALPILWIGVALVLGQFRLRQIAEKLQIRQDLAKRTSEAERLADYAKDLEARCQRLERELTTKSAGSVKPVLDALSAIVTGPAGIDAALDAVTNSIWPGAQVSVFAVSPASCHLAGRSGWPATASWASEIGAAHPLYRAIAGERRTVSILNRGDEAVLSGHGMAAEPILSPDGGRVVGMLKIETMDLAQLNDGISGHLALIARLLAPLLSEPRIAVANDQEGGDRSASKLARLTRGWRLQHWRAADDSSAGGRSHDEESEHPVRPKRSS
jgi:hypothetical protein